MRHLFSCIAPRSSFRLLFWLRCLLPTLAHPPSHTHPLTPTSHTHPLTPTLSHPPSHTHPLTPQIRTTVLLQRSQGEKKGRRRRLGCRRGVFAGSSSFLMEGVFGCNCAILRAVVCEISRKKPTSTQFPKNAIFTNYHITHHYNCRRPSNAAVPSLLQQPTAAPPRSSWLLLLLPAPPLRRTSEEHWVMCDFLRLKNMRQKH
jgi:hypothetical protein